MVEISKGRPTPPRPQADRRQPRIDHPKPGGKLEAGPKLGAPRFDVTTRAQRTALGRDGAAKDAVNRLPSVHAVADKGLQEYARLRNLKTGREALGGGKISAYGERLVNGLQGARLSGAQQKVLVDANRILVQHDGLQAALQRTPGDAGLRKTLEAIRPEADAARIRLRTLARAVAGQRQAANPIKRVAGKLRERASKWLQTNANSKWAKVLDRAANGAKVGGKLLAPPVVAGIDALDAQRVGATKQGNIVRSAMQFMMSDGLYTAASKNPAVLGMMLLESGLPPGAQLSKGFNVPAQYLGALVDRRFGGDRKGNEMEARLVEEMMNREHGPIAKSVAHAGDEIGASGFGSYMASWLRYLRDTPLSEVARDARYAFVD